MLIKKYSKSFVFIVAIVITVYNPYLIIQSVKNGLIICYENIIPSLFVFMVIANYATQSDILNVLSLPLRFYGKLMKCEDNSYSGYLLLSLIGGFAVGAQLIKKLEASGYSEKATTILGISMINNSLGFCVFSLGAGMLKNYTTGILLYVACVLASLVSAFIFSFIFEYNIVSKADFVSIAPVTITDAINNAVSSTLSICGFVVLFNIVCEVILLYSFENEILSIFLCRITELTVGCIKILEFSAKNPYYLCVALSIFPISTLCQVYHFTDNKKLLSVLLKSRLIHTPLSLLFYSVLSNIFPVSITTATFNSAVLKSYSYNAELSFTLFIISFIFVKLFDQNKLFTKRV